VGYASRDCIHTKRHASSVTDKLQSKEISRRSVMKQNIPKDIFAILHATNGDRFVSWPRNTSTQYIATKSQTKKKIIE
jgi:hypothetical protein